MIKIVPLLLSISVSSIASNGSRGLVDRPIISKPGPITVSSISSQIEAMSRSHYYPPISFPIFESEEIIISSSSQASSFSSSSASNPNQDYFFCEKYGPFIEDERNKERDSRKGCREEDGREDCREEDDHEGCDEENSREGRREEDSREDCTEEDSREGIDSEKDSHKGISSEEDNSKEKSVRRKDACWRN